MMPEVKPVVVAPETMPMEPATLEVGAMPKLPEEDAVLQQVTAICANTHNEAPKTFRDAFVSNHKFVMVQMKDTLATFERLAFWVHTLVKHAVVRFENDDEELTVFLRNIWMLPPQATKIGDTTQMLPVMPLIMYPTTSMVEKLLKLKKIPFYVLVVVDDAYAPDPVLRKLRHASHVVVVPPLLDKVMETCLQVLMLKWNLHVPNTKFLLNRANGDPRWLYNNLYFDKLQGKGGTMFFDTRLTDIGLLRQADMFLLHGYREIWRYHVAPPLTSAEMAVFWKNPNIVRVEPNEVYAHGTMKIRDVKTKECVAATDAFLGDDIKLYLKLNYPVALIQAASSTYMPDKSVALVDAMSFVADALCDADVFGGKHGFGGRDEADYVFMQATHIGIAKHFPKFGKMEFDWRFANTAHDTYFGHLRQLKDMHGNAEDWYHAEQTFSPIAHLWDDYVAAATTPFKEEAAKFMTVALLLTPPQTSNALTRAVDRTVPDPEDRKARTVAEWFGRRTGFDNYDANDDAITKGYKVGYDFTANDAWMFAWALLAKTPLWSSMPVTALVNTVLGVLRLANNMWVDTTSMYMTERVPLPDDLTDDKERVKNFPISLQMPMLSFRPCPRESCRLERCKDCLKKTDWLAPCVKCKVSPCVYCRGFLDNAWRVMIAKKYTKAV